MLIFAFASRGLSIIMVPSERPEVLDVSDRVLIIGEGESRGDFANDGLTQEYIPTAAIGADTEGKTPLRILNLSFAM
jgi:D-xylose transport system ATP-binding protein